MQGAKRRRGLRAALFDLDGTLVHTHIDFDRMKREILMEVRRHGVSTDCLGHLDVLALIARAAEAASDPPALLEACEALLVGIELAACEGAEPAEGAAETLAWLMERGIRVGIVTRNSRPAVDRVLRELPLPYEVLLTRADTPRVKPDPLHLELALERLGVGPAEAVMVGDHLMDVQGGRAAGMHTVGMLLPQRPPDYFHEVRPDHVIRALPELRAWISPS